MGNFSMLDNQGVLVVSTPSTRCPPLSSWQVTVTAEAPAMVEGCPGLNVCTGSRDDLDLLMI